MRFLVLAGVILILAAQASAQIGVVRTTAGESLEGRIRITPTSVVVVNAARAMIRSIDLANVSRISFSRSTRQSDSEFDSARIAAEWKEADIGSIFTTGSTRFEPRALTVRSSGLNVDGESDSFHFVYQLMQGDSEIVAEVTSVQYTHPNAKAGLMMREDLGEYSRNVMFALTSMRGGVLQVRGEERAQTEIGIMPGLFAPYWLKLKRRGNEYSAYLSQNGRVWSLVQKLSVAMEEQFYVGLAVTSGRAAMLNWSTFSKVRAGRKVLNEDFTPEVELVSGSIVRGRPQRADLEEVVLSGEPRVVQIPTPQVARISYQPLMGELRWKTRASRPGVWVSNGDFFDGDFRALEGHRLTISSVLYGLRTFDVDEEVLAVVMQSPKTQRPQFEMETVDGTLLLASDLALGEGEFKVREMALGELRVPAFELRELRRR